MIKILIVDDTAEKRNEVRFVVTDILGENVHIEEVTCLNSLRLILSRERFDIVVLDLNIPRFENEVAEQGMGATIFDWFSVNSSDLKRPGYLVGLTAFPEIEKSLSSKFEDEGFGLLSYSTVDTRWRNQLAKILAHATAVASQAKACFKYDLGIVTALSHVELEALMASDGGWSTKKFEGDRNLYFEGQFREEGKVIDVIAASAAKMGMPASTAMAMQIIHSARPQHLVMVGIAAGVKGEFGDILIAEQAFDYGSGKRRKAESGGEVFEPAPEPIPIDRGIRARLAEFRTRQDVLSSIYDGWNGKKPATLNAQIGAIASGAAVLEDRELVSILKCGQRKLIGVEMEIYGLFEAASVCSDPAPTTFAVKSICDFASADKNDEYQQYAAYTSVEFVRRFALEYLGQHELD